MTAWSSLSTRARTLREAQANSIFTKARPSPRAYGQASTVERGYAHRTCHQIRKVGSRGMMERAEVMVHST
jgi:hypothetical protein